MIQVSILRRDLPGNGQRILPQDSTPTVPPTPPSSNPHLTPHPRIGVFLSFSRARQLLSPSLGNCYRTIQPRMQIAALSRVSRMTFDEIRFRGKEKETRIPLSRSHSLHPPPYSCLQFTSFHFSQGSSLPPTTTKNPLLPRY